MSFRWKLNDQYLDVGKIGETDTAPKIRSLLFDFLELLGCYMTESKILVFVSLCQFLVLGGNDFSSFPSLL